MPPCLTTGTGKKSWEVRLRAHILVVSSRNLSYQLFHHPCSQTLSESLSGQTFLEIGGLVKQFHISFSNTEVCLNIQRLAKFLFPGCVYFCAALLGWCLAKQKNFLANLSTLTSRCESHNLGKTLLSNSYHLKGVQIYPPMHQAQEISWSHHNHNFGLFFSERRPQPEAERLLRRDRDERGLGRRCQPQLQRPR